MAFGPRDDLWYVDQRGYQWIDPEIPKRLRPLIEHPGPFLIPVDWRRPELVQSLAKSYPLNPLKFDAVFYRLAKTPTTQEGIVEFANKYGMLGLTIYVPGAKTDDGREIFAPAEPWHLWAGEIGNIAFACRCWKALRQEDENSLAAIKRYLDAGKLGQEMRELGFDHAPSPALPGILAYDERPVASALEYLITQGLENRFSGELVRDDDGTGWALEFGASNLIGAIWRQFAQAMANGVWKDCRHCGRPFRPKTIRAEYCSASHKTLFHRRKRTRKPK